MRQGPLDWIARVVMLALAGMVSLSIIGAIAAIPSGSIEGRLGVEQARQPAPEPVPEEQPAREAEPPSEDEQPQANAVGSEKMVAAPAAPEGQDLERWLEAITYALLALAGLAALAVLLLWRSLRERRRASDALEALAAQGRR